MEKKYYAFISYSRKNSKAAAYLHKQLEHFRVPVKYVAEENRPTGQKFLRPVFRDRRDLEAREGSFTSYIQTAIEESRYLIVLCSPESADSIWVNKEIKHFLATHDNDYNAIVPVILNGEPGSDGATECLPEALRSEEITMRNLPSMIPDEGDDEKTGWENGVVQAMSYMLKVNREKIKATVDAEKVRQAKIYAFIGIAAMIVFALLAGWALHAERQAAANEKRAIAGEMLAKKNASEANLFYEHWLSTKNSELNNTIKRHSEFNIFAPHVKAIKEISSAEIKFKEPCFGLNDGSSVNSQSRDCKVRNEICNHIKRKKFELAQDVAKKNLTTQEYSYVHALVLIRQHKLREATFYLHKMSEIHKNDSNKYRLLKAYAFYEQGNVETVKKELFSIIADKNTTTLFKAYCYYMLATTCFPDNKKIQNLYIFNALNACNIVSIPIIYPLCIQHLINFKCSEYTRYNLHKMIACLGTYYSARLDARSQKLQYFVHLIQEKYRGIVFPGMGPNELAIENCNRILNRFLISLDLQSVKLLDKYLGGMFYDDDFFIISMLKNYNPKQMRQIYIECFQKDICNSLKQYFHLAQRCKKHEDKERCYSEIRNFLSEFTSDEISRYKELQEIQKRLDDIYDKKPNNTK